MDDSLGSLNDSLKFYQRLNASKNVERMQKNSLSELHSLENFSQI
jgi:hypothetical protein